MGGKLKYDGETADTIMELEASHKKARAVIDSMLEDYFERDLLSDKIDPGLKGYELERLYPRMQTLAFVVNDYLFEAGKLIEALNEGGIIKPEQLPA